MVVGVCGSRSSKYSYSFMRSHSQFNVGPKLFPFLAIWSVYIPVCVSLSINSISPIYAEFVAFFHSPIWYGKALSNYWSIDDSQSDKSLHGQNMGFGTNCTKNLIADICHWLYLLTLFDRKSISLSNYDCVNNKNSLTFAFCSFAALFPLD